MIKITDDLMNNLSNKARESIRKRCIYKFHKNDRDNLQRMLNVAEPDTYVRPHKHEIQKTEIFLILKGRILILEFDDNGKVTDHIILDSDSGDKGMEISPNAWHSFIVLKENSVLYELKEGPYTGPDKIFAQWAPEEGTKEAKEFNNKILSILSLL